jgi:solute carrier family 34 (sodium-dependent phosphate cotransporter)
MLDLIFDPILGLLVQHLHRVVLFLLGLVTLVGSFQLFDRALPEIHPEHSRFKQIAYVVYRPQVMFLLGIGVTCLTLSVSVSLGLLVPLSAKGFVRRENIIPYIMGANISTFLDTLVVSLLVGEPRALTVVLAEMLSVAFVSLVILLGFYTSYRDGLEWCLEWATASRRAFLVFAGCIMLIPVALMLA